MANTKTPVMVLQELSVKKGWPTPEYNLIHSKQGTHDNEFFYEVRVESAIGYGQGRSKQIAKHKAASDALDCLIQLKLYCPDETIIKAPRSEFVGSPIKLAANAIGSLNEKCLENKIPLPTFVEISDVGPPHCKEFTYECKIALISTRATAGTKKQAKQLAAKEMIDRLTQTLPDLETECTDSELPEITEDQNVIDRYIQIRKPKQNLSMKIVDYDMNLKNIAKEKEVDFESLRKCLYTEPTEENLTTLLDKLELNYNIVILNESKNGFLISLSLNTDVPFTILAEENTYVASVVKVLEKTFDYLRVFFD